jgi:hypothetical protein
MRCPRDRAVPPMTRSSTLNACSSLPRSDGVGQRPRVVCPSRPRPKTERGGASYSDCLLIVYRRDDGSCIQPETQPSAERSRLHSVVRPTKNPSVGIAVAGGGRSWRRLFCASGLPFFTRYAAHLVSRTRRPPHLLQRALFGARATRPLPGLIWPKDGCASIA